jgi:cellulose synthase/poly-beta-1,6-N-acetylglucosamine synthase-like glycosyltransferase
VIVAARDAADTLAKCLAALHAQEYEGDWELFVIDDHSKDDTLAMAREAASGHPDWHVLATGQATRWLSRKKGALETAFQHARGDLLLLTDADCTPPPSWLAGMAAAHRPVDALCAGFSPQQAPGSSRLWQDFLHADSLAAALVAAGGIGHGRGITCTGRNLSCRRQALAEIGGYAALPDTLSGDDDFLLQILARSRTHSISYAIASDTAVPALGPANWRDLILQKRRHLSAGIRYSLPLRLGYFLYHSTNFVLWSALLIAPFYNPLLILPLAVKVLFDGAALGFWSRKLFQSLSLGGLLAWELFSPLYHLAAFPWPGKEIPWKKP